MRSRSWSELVQILIAVVPLSILSIILGLILEIDPFTSLVAIYCLMTFIYAVWDFSKFARPLPKEFLLRKIDYIEFEAVRAAMPLDSQKKRMDDFLDTLLPDDEVWLWRTVDYSTWWLIKGREGFVIVRNGKPINQHIATEKN